MSMARLFNDVQKSWEQLLKNIQHSRKMLIRIFKSFKFQCSISGDIPDAFTSGNLQIEYVFNYFLIALYKSRLLWQQNNISMGALMTCFWYLRHNIDRTALLEKTIRLPFSINNRASVSLYLAMTIQCGKINNFFP